MTNVGRWVIWGLLPSLVAGVLLNLLVPFRSINSELFAVVLADPILRVIVLTGLLLLPMYFGLDYISRIGFSLLERRREIQKSNSPSVFSPSSPPSKLIWKGVIRQYGADWYVMIGESQRSSKPYAYIDSGPRCPSCQTEMLHRTKTKLFALKHRVWLCPECETVVNRPRKMLFEEEQGVKNTVKKHISAALSSENPEDYIESLDNITTNEWGDRDY